MLAIRNNRIQDLIRVIVATMDPRADKHDWNSMAKAIVKVDVRSRVSLLETLQAQHEQRRAYGELAFSFCIDNNKRNIGYVILEWSSLRSLHQFLGSSEALEIIGNWPTIDTLEILELYDMTEDINVK